MLWFRQTRKGVESTKLIPVHSPSRTYFMKMVKERRISFSNSTNRVWETRLRNKCVDVINILLIIMFETSETSRMKQDGDNHNFGIIHTIRLIARLINWGFLFNHIFFLLQCKFFAEIICQQYISVTLASENIVVIVLNVIIRHCKLNTFIATSQTIRRIFCPLISSPRYL